MLKPKLVSSAAGGKTTAPKAPARRRHAPAAPPPSAQTTPIVVPSATVPSLPPNQYELAVEKSTQDTANVPAEPAPPNPPREPQIEHPITVEPPQTLHFDSGFAPDGGEDDKPVESSHRPVIQESIADQHVAEQPRSVAPSRDESDSDQSAKETPVRVKPTIERSITEQNTLEPSVRGESPRVSRLEENLVTAEHSQGQIQPGTPDVTQNEPTSIYRPSEPLSEVNPLEAEQSQEQDVNSKEPEPQAATSKGASSAQLNEQQQGLIAEQQTAESRLAEYHVQDEPSAEERVPSEAQNTRASARKLGAKRVRMGTSTNDTPRPTKRVKRSSARSNVRVQSIAQGGEPPPQNSTEEPASTNNATDTSHSQRGQRRKRPTQQPLNTQRKGKSKGKGRAKSASRVVNSDEDEPVQTPAALTELHDDEAELQPTQKQPKRKQRRSKSRREPAEGEEDQPQSDDEDAEQHEIDPTTLSMWDLSHDSRHGKTSEREKAMAAINWAEIAQQRRDAVEQTAAGEQDKTADGVVQSVEGANRTATDAQNDEQGMAEPEIGAEDGEADDIQSTRQDLQDHQDGLNNAETNEPDESDQGGGANDDEPEENDVTLMLDADGNITIDETSLRIDRGAAVDAAMNSGKPIEDVNDLTVQLNRTTWMNNNRRDPLDRVPAWKWKSDPWLEEETDRFYEALRMFGTDFFIISKMFHPKTRRMIKAKFNREEKLDPQRINDALSGKSTRRMNLEHYSQQTGRDVSVYTRYEGYDHAQQIIQASMKEKEDAMTSTIQQEAAAAEERAELERQQKKEKRGRRGKGKKARARGGGTMGGAPEDFSS